METRRNTPDDLNATKKSNFFGFNGSGRERYALF